MQQQQQRPARRHVTYVVDRSTKSYAHVHVQQQRRKRRRASRSWRMTMSSRWTVPVVLVGRRTARRTCSSSRSLAWKQRRRPAAELVRGPAFSKLPVRPDCLCSLPIHRRAAPSSTGSNTNTEGQGQGQARSVPDLATPTQPPSAATVSTGRPTTTAATATATTTSNGTSSSSSSANDATVQTTAVAAQTQCQAPSMKTSFEPVRIVLIPSI